MMAASIDIRDLELNALLEITQAINNNLPEEDLYKIYKFTLLGDLKVKRLVMFVNEQQNWKCQVHFGSNQSWSEVTLPKSYLETIDIVSLDGKDQQFHEFDTVFPVIHKEKKLAIVFIGGFNNEKEGGNSTFLRALTNILIVAIENKKLARRQLEQEAYKKEMEIAKKVQNFLFPNELPDTEQLKITADYFPHHDIGGDYYDYMAIDEDKFLICVADVSGKGVPAALLMSNFQASLRTLIRKVQETKEIISELNHLIYVSSNGENFITFFLGIYDIRKSVFEYINCGHNPMYLIADNKVNKLEEGTTLLGMFDPLPFLTTTRIEGLTDFFFFGYTDGLTETFNQDEEQFDNERLERLLGNTLPNDLRKLHQTILSELDQFRNGTPYHDDITMLSCLVKKQ